MLRGLYTGRRSLAAGLFALALLVPSLALAASPLSDLGDAPDSTNHFGTVMAAYPLAGVTARFPTVFDPATGAPQGPKHLDITAQYWLGAGVSREDEADTGADGDGVNNITPPPSPGTPNQDRLDDGVFPLSPSGISLPQCGSTQFRYIATAPATATLPRGYVNVWFDFNRDGDWQDTLTCTLVTGAVLTVREWAVQNQLISVPLGTSTVFATPVFTSYHTGNAREVWMRISIAETVAPGAPVDGRGPASGYRYGETEDYYLRYCSTCSTPTFLP